MKKIVFNTRIIVLIISVYFLANCNCNYKQIICPTTNMPVLYPKSQKCAKQFYEDAVSSYSPNFNITLNVLERIKLSGGAEIEAKTEILKEKLTSEDQLIQGTLQSSFLALQMRPCDSDVMTTYKKALDDAANYKIRLTSITKDIENSKTDTEIKQTLDKYAQGKDDGKKVGTIIGALDRYYTENNSYPPNLNKLSGVNVTEAIKTLESSIIYVLEDKDSFTLRFAGKDRILNTEDDKIHTGFKGKSK